MGLSSKIREPELQALFRYWTTRRGRTGIPMVHDMDPLNLPPKFLPWLFLFRREADHRFRCRLAGTAIVHNDGCDTTGWYLDDLPWTADKPRQVHLFEEAASTGLPIYYTGQTRAGPNSLRRFSRLLLPLGRDRRSVDHMFGMLCLDGANDSAPCRPAMLADVDRLLTELRATPADFYQPSLHEPAQRTQG